MNTETLLADIPTQLAYDAHRNSSFVPEKRAQQERDGYAGTLTQDYENLCGIITPEKEHMRDLLESEFARYREGYRNRYMKHLASRARCASWMITGPSNFPAYRIEKRNRVAQKRLEEMLEFRNRALDAIRKTLCPELRPIMSGDSDAVARLREKLNEAEAHQEKMKRVNAAIRKNLKADKETQVSAVVATGIPEVLAREMLQSGRFGGMGYASFELTNNSANIRRMKQRLQHLESCKAAPDVARDSASGIRLEDSPSENRVRLFFPGKPDAQVRTRLKSCGFRWSPTLGCWQAYRNNSSIATAKKEAGL